MKVVIMAGGFGTRISQVFPDIPKPLIPIDGVPVLEREIVSLQKQGFTDIILTVSYLADKIINYFGDGSQLGVHIDYFIEETPLGNAGALVKMRAQEILNDDFLLLNADSMFDIDFNRFISYHYRKRGLVTLFTHPNSHPYDSGLLVADSEMKVIKWLAKEDARPRWYKNRVNAGLHVINPSILDGLTDLADQIGNYDDVTGKRIKIDLDRQVLKPLCLTGEVYCYDSPEYVKDMGTPERYNAVCQDFNKGLVNSRNLKNKQKAIFLDRDGTINKYVGFLKDIDDFELLPGVVEAVKRINNSGYLVVVVTNQPVIARGDISEEQLLEIHQKMETLFGEAGAYLDKIYFCPHHPHKGYKGEVETLKIKCECRKPAPGMLLQAAKELNINLPESWMIGDSENDIAAGKAAGCHTVLIGKENYGQNITVDSLFEFINQNKL